MTSMSPLFYLVIGLIGGGFVVAVIILVVRRGSSGGVEGELVKRLEIIDRGLRDEFSRNREEAGAAAKNQREELTKSLENVRSIVDLRINQLQEDNAKQIDKMRATVDEKLQGTLEKRLGESFKLVSERLEQVHQGLGAMQQLASDVGGLMYFSQISFAHRFNCVSKVFVAASTAVGSPFSCAAASRSQCSIEKGDPTAVDAAIRTLETQLKRCAKDICEKYINPPKTTDFALMFLPSEGLYAEAIRRVGLVQNVQRDCRVTFVGPTTLAALLNSLHMGFRTLAIQKRSSEVWNLLATVKTEFGKFGEALSAVKEKIDQASRKIEDVDVRSRAITKKLRDVEELPSNPQPLLRDLLPSEDDEGSYE